MFPFAKDISEVVNHFEKSDGERERAQTCPPWEFLVCLKIYLRDLALKMQQPCLKTIEKLKRWAVGLLGSDLEIQPPCRRSWYVPTYMLGADADFWPCTYASTLRNFTLWAIGSDMQCCPIITCWMAIMDNIFKHQ